MAIVKLEVFGWVAAECRRSQRGNLLADEKVEDGASVGDVLRQIAQKDLCFRNAVFTGNMVFKSGISVVLNGRILGQPTFLESKVKNGDTVMLLPAIDGG